VGSIRTGLTITLLVLCAGAGPADAVLTAGGDHRGTDHTDHDHAGEILPGVDLSPDPVSGTPSIVAEADFSGAVLDGADLRRVVGGCEDDLTLTDCTSFAGASLDGADLSGAELALADLSNADLRFVVGVATTLDGARLTGAMLGGSDWLRASFVGADMTGSVDAAAARLRDSDLTGVVANGVRLAAADLRGAVLVDIELRGADLSLAELIGVDARCADAITDPPPPVIALDTCVELHGASLRFARLIDGFFQHALLVEDGGGVPVDLEGTDLTRTDFSDACFTAVAGGDCDPGLPGAPARLVGARVDGLRVDRAVMRGADLRGVDGGCVAPRPGDPDTSLRCPSFVDADLRDADLSGSRVLGGDFAGAALTGADLARGLLVGTVFDGATLDGVRWVGADLTDGSLTGATAAGADWTNAILASADLTDASFDGATFAAGGTTTVTGASAECTPGPGERPVDLTGAVLVGADLSGALNFHEGCILVDDTTTYDGVTTKLPPFFTLRSAMTDVPEPGSAAGHAAALAAVASLARAARRRAMRG
jgi:uncharacterized protein YjbI with pentapeptide repeats